MKKSIVLLYIGLVMLFAIGTIFPLFKNGFFEFHDNTQVVRVYEMGRSLAMGHFPVRWVEGLGYGYGYPIFNFYAPLPYYIGGFLLVLGVDALLATKIMIGLGMILASVTMFLLVRTLFGNKAGMLSAVMYAYFPYHAVNLYVRGAVSELYAYAFLPLVFLFLYKLSLIKKDVQLSSYSLSVVFLSVSIFLVALSHNLSFFMLVILLFAFLVVTQVNSPNKKKYITSSVIGVVLGIGLSSFYVIPAFLEMNYTNVGSQIGGGADFRDHFVCLGQFVNSQWGFGGSVPGCVDGMSFKLGKLHGTLVAISFALLVGMVIKKRIKQPEKIALGAMILFGFCVFLITFESHLIWEAIPFMEFVQYPWRFINFVGIFVSIIGGYFVFKLEQFFGNRLAIVAMLFVSGIIIVGNLGLFVPQKTNSFPVTYYTNPEYVKFTVSKISDEYMPYGFSKPLRVTDLPNSVVELINTSGNAGVLVQEVDYVKVSYEVQKAGLIHINIAYFPAWKAYINGEQVEIYKASDGMNIAVDKGKGIFELKFKQTAIEILGNSISLIALLIVFVTIIGQLLIKRNGK